jgi:MAP/microtubule affinity-regulating kinase
MRESVTRGKYRIPFYLSEGCEKLLRKFLVRDPLKRPSLDILIDDEWLNDTFDSSPITLDVNDDIVGEDQFILNIMETRFGVSKDEIMKGLKENIYNENLAIYFLLYHEKSRNGEAVVAKISESLSIKNPLPQANAQHSDHRTAAAATSPIDTIAEEGASEENLKQGESKVPDSAAAPAGAPRRKSNINQEPKFPPPASSAGAAKVPTAETSAAPQARPTVATKRQRRFTVSGDAEMQKIADAQKEDQELLSKLKNMQVGQAAEAIPDTNPSQATQATQQAAHTDAVVPRNKAVNDNARQRRISVAVPHENYVQPLPDKAPEPKKDAAPAQEKPKVEKRKSAIAGFLKLSRKGGEDGEDVPRTSNETVDEPVGSDDQKPRSLRFTFASNTTSSKSPDQMIQDILNSAAKNVFKTRTNTRYLVEVTAQPPNDLPGAEVIKIEVEVCKLPRLKNLHGFRFKRLSGASADYKTVCEQLLSNIQL